MWVESDSEGLKGHVGDDLKGSDDQSNDGGDQFSGSKPILRA